MLCAGAFGLHQYEQDSTGRCQRCCHRCSGRRRYCDHFRRFGRLGSPCRRRCRSSCRRHHRQFAGRPSSLLPLVRQYRRCREGALFPQRRSAAHRREIPCRKFPSLLEQFQFETLRISNLTPVVSRKKRGFSRSLQPGVTVPLPRVSPFSQLKRSRNWSSMQHAFPFSRRPAVVLLCVFLLCLISLPLSCLPGPAGIAVGDVLAALCRSPWAWRSALAGNLSHRSGHSSVACLHGAAVRRALATAGVALQGVLRQSSGRSLYAWHFRRSCVRCEHHDRFWRAAGGLSRHQRGGADFRRRVAWRAAGAWRCALARAQRRDLQP